MKRKVLLTGASGFLGARIAQRYRDEWTIFAPGHRELDVTDPAAVRAALEALRPEIVLHCAAVSDIGETAADPARSEAVNVRGPQNLAEACASVGAKLILCSSDQVYFGNGVMTPHLENEPLRPPHLYGRQKALAEALVADRCPGAVCLRLSMMYADDAEGRREHANFLGKIQEAVRTGAPLRFATHDRRSITDVRDVAEAMATILDWPGGNYNLGSENDLSTYETVRELLRALGARAEVTPDEEAFADAPRNLRMNVEKAKRAGVQLPTTLDGFGKIRRRA